MLFDEKKAQTSLHGSKENTIFAGSKSNDFDCFKTYVAIGYGEAQEVGGMKIVTYKPIYRDDFIRLNKQWIETYFKLEPSDYETFAHLEDNIIKRGGQIFLAIDDDNAVVGCCALKPHTETDSYELAKMAVEPQAQGHQVGHRLGVALIEYAREIGAKRIFLEGNTRLAASIHLYRKLGFKEISLEGNTYERCDIIMELIL